MNWIWLIVFVPYIGTAIYFFQEILPGLQRNTGFSLFSRTPGIPQLERELKFADTFANRVALADACFAAGHTERAIRLYEESLTGAFKQNEHVMGMLIQAYAAEKQHEKVLPLGKKLIPLPQFNRSRIHVIYAMALAQTGNTSAAEEEFQKMKGRFGNYEARFHYALFLKNSGRTAESRALLQELLAEKGHLSSRERRDNHQWFALAATELKNQAV